MRQEQEPAPLVPPPAAPTPAANADIISKSLRGNRTDDEAATWDERSARDFDWGR